MNYEMKGERVSFILTGCDKWCSEMWENCQKKVIDA